MRPGWLRLTPPTRIALAAGAWCAAAIALVACDPGSAHKRGSLAGFEGHILLHATEPDKPPSDFLVTAKGDQLRVDVPGGDKPAANGGVTLGHAVYEHATSHALMFFDTTHEYRDMDLSKRIATDTAGAPAVAKTGGHRVIAGVACDDATVKGTDGGRTDLCLAEGVSYLEIFRVQFGPKGTESPLSREFREHTTFPLERVEYDASGKELARLVALRIDRDAVPASTFAVPAGYKKVDPHFGGAPGARGPGSPGATSRPK